MDDFSSELERIRERIRQDDDPLAEVRGLSFMQDLHARRNRELYRQVSEQDEDVRNGHLSGIARYGAIAATGAGDFGGQILMGLPAQVLDNLGATSEKLASKTNSMMSKIAREHGIPEDDISSIMPEGDSDATTAAKWLLGASNTWNSNMQDAYKYVAGENPTLVDRAVHGAGTSFGYTALSALLGLGVESLWHLSPYWAGAIGGAIGGTLEAGAESGSFFSNKYAEDPSRYKDALRMANYSFIANAPTDMLLNTAGNVISPLFSGVRGGLGTRLAVGIAGDIVEENAQEAKQTATEIAAERTYQSRDLSFGNFLSNLASEYRKILPYKNESGGWEYGYLAEQAPEVSLSTLISNILMLGASLSTRSGRRKIVDRALRSDLNVHKRGDVAGDEDLLSILANPASNMEIARDNLQSKINAGYETYGSDLDTEPEALADISDMERELGQIDYDIANSWSNNAAIRDNFVQDEDMSLFPDGKKPFVAPVNIPAPEPPQASGQNAVIPANGNEIGRHVGEITPEQVAKMPESTVSTVMPLGSQSNIQESEETVEPTEIETRQVIGNEPELIPENSNTQSKDNDDFFMDDLLHSTENVTVSHVGGQYDQAQNSSDSEVASNVTGSLGRTTKSNPQTAGQEDNDIIGGWNFTDNGENHKLTVSAGEFSDEYQAQKQYHGRYIEVKDESGRVVARWSPYTGKYQMAEEAENLHPQLEELLRRHQKEYLQKGGFLDNNGKLISDGNEEYRKQYKARFDTNPEGASVHPSNSKTSTSARTDTRNIWGRVGDWVTEKRAFKRVKKDIYNQIMRAFRKAIARNRYLNMRETRKKVGSRIWEDIKPSVMDKAVRREQTLSHARSVAKATAHLAASSIRGFAHAYGMPVEEFYKDGMVFSAVFNPKNNNGTPGKGSRGYMRFIPAWIEKKKE